VNVEFVNRDIQSVKTLINNPKYCDEEIEEPIPGYKKVAM